MMTGFRRSMFGTLALGLTFALLLAAGFMSPSVAHAQEDTNTINVGNGTLVNRVVVYIPVTATCTLPEGAIVNDFTQSGVSLTQAVGRTAISAMGWFASPICDGLPHTYQGTVTPDTGSLLFHGGPALASAYFSVPYYDPMTGTSGYAQAGVNNVPILIRG